VQLLVIYIGYIYILYIFYCFLICSRLANSKYHDLIRAALNFEYLCHRLFSCFRVWVLFAGGRLFTRNRARSVRGGYESVDGWLGRWSLIRLFEYPLTRIPGYPLVSVRSLAAGHACTDDDASVGDFSNRRKPAVSKYLLVVAIESFAELSVEIDRHRYLDNRTRGNETY